MNKEFEEVMRLADEYAETRNMCGYHLYNAKTQAARNALIEALSAGTPAAPEDKALQNLIAVASEFLSVWEEREGYNGESHPSSYARKQSEKLDHAIDAVRASMHGEQDAPQAQQPGAADGWLITYTNGAGEKRRVVSGHNCVADYRDQFPDAKSFPLTVDARAGVQAVPNQAESAMVPSTAYERHLAEGKRKLRPDEPVPPSGPQTPWCKSCGGCYEWGGNGLIHHAGCNRNPGKSPCWYEPAPLLQ